MTDRSKAGEFDRFSQKVDILQDEVGRLNDELYDLKEGSREYHHKKLALGVAVADLRDARNALLERDLDLSQERHREGPGLVRGREVGSVRQTEERVPAAPNRDLS